APAAALLEHFTRVPVSEATVRRLTERAGQAYVEVQTAQVAELERALPPAPAGPAVQLVSVDGAMVPLRGKGEGADAKLLAFGAGTTTLAGWLGQQAERLLRCPPEEVLDELRRMRADLADGRLAGASGEALAVVGTSLEYLDKRREQIRYARFRERGYPIGSGAVESGNKLVTE